MSQIGRNDPCPCGSGKKYKKCCLGKTSEQINPQQPVSKLKNILTYKDVNPMTTSQIFSRLQALGVAVDEPQFLAGVDQFNSAQALSESWFENHRVTAKGKDDDFLWLAAWVLWERLAPPDRLCMETIDELIHQGGKLSDQGDSRAACDIWLKAWNGLLHWITPGVTTADELEEMVGSDYFLMNYYQDLEMELHNAGTEDPAYFEKRIDYCRAFCRIFPDYSKQVIHNMRRAICDTYVSLNRYDEAVKELDALVKDFPDNPWSFIQYGDFYKFDGHPIQDNTKAIAHYEKALQVCTDDYDKQAVEERLEDFE